MDVWAWAWIGWMAYFAGVEGWALVRSYRARKAGKDDPRDTLSEHVWTWFGVNTKGIGIEPNANWWMRIRRVLLGAFLLWLAIHFIAGGQYV